jgi:ABC-type uncharacterized transport system permease subunit
LRRKLQLVGARCWLSSLFTVAAGRISGSCCSFFRLKSLHRSLIEG